MKNIKTLLLAVFFVQFVFACTSKEKAGYYPNIFATSPQDALNRLDQHDSELLAQWVGRVDKSCDARSVFEDSPTPNLPKGIDWNLFFEKLGKKYVLKDESGMQLMFGKPNMSTNTTVTRVFRSENPMADNAYHLAAEFQMNNGSCEVYLYHQKVFETKMANSIPLIASWYEGKSNFGPVPVEVKYEEGSTNKFSLVSNHGIDSAVLAALRIDSKVSEFLERKFGIDHDVINQIFEANSVNTSPHIMEVEGRHLLQFGQSDRRLIGSRTDLDAMLTELPSNSTVNVTIISPENEIWNIHAKLLVSDGGTSKVYDGMPFDDRNREPSYKEVPMTNFSVEDVHLSTEQPTAKEARYHFKNCIMSRYSAFESASTDPVPYLSVKHPCAGLVDYNAFDDTMLGDSELRGLYVKALKNDPPASDTKWNGWDEALRELANKYSTAEFQKKLDPAGESKVIKNIVDQREIARQAAEVHHLGKEYKEALQNAAFSWGLKNQAPDSTKLAAVVQTAANSTDELKNSTVALINAFGENPTATDVTDTIDYISKLSPEFRVAAGELSAAAKSAGVSDWVSGKLSDGYQKKITETQLDSWKELVNRALQFQEQENKLSGKPVNSKDFSRSQFYVRALDEQWTIKDYENVRSFAKFAQFRDECSSQKDKDTFAVLNCLGSASVSNKEKMLMDPDYKGRYSELANSLHAKLSALKGSEYYDFKKSVATTFMGPFWKTCRNAKFKKFADELHIWLNQLAEEKSFEKRSEIRAEFIDYMSNDCNWP
jgi:hypothetical protein